MTLRDYLLAALRREFIAMGIGLRCEDDGEGICRICGVEIPDERKAVKP